MDLFTLSVKQKIVIALVVVAWAFLLDQYSEINLAKPLVELEQAIKIEQGR